MSYQNSWLQWAGSIPFFIDHNVWCLMIVLIPGAVGLSHHNASVWYSKRIIDSLGIYAAIVWTRIISGSVICSICCLWEFAFWLDQELSRGVKYWLGVIISPVKSTWPWVDGDDVIIICICASPSLLVPLWSRVPPVLSPGMCHGEPFTPVLMIGDAEQPCTKMDRW